MTSLARTLRLALLLALASLGACATSYHPRDFTTDSGGPAPHHFRLLFGSSGPAPLSPVDCIVSTSTPCNTTSNPGNGTQGMPAWLAFGTLNVWGAQLGLFADQAANEVLATPNGTTGILSLRALVAADMPAGIAWLFGTPVAGHCAEFYSATQIEDSGSGCGGSGSVTSVGLSVPAWLTVSGCPITTSGTCTIAGATGLTTYEVLGTGAGGALALVPLTAAYLPTSGVTAGSYTSANITVDQYGRVTVASNGSGSSTAFQANGTGLSSSTTVNFESGSAVDGITPTVSNPSGGNVQVGLTVVPATLQAAMVAANAIAYTPTLASGATNDWDPSGGAGIRTVGVAWTTPNSAGSTVDGILSGSATQQIKLCNAATLGTNGSYIILENQDSSDSTAANRLMGAGNQALGPQMCVMLTYLAGTVDRWEMGRIEDAGTPATQPLATGTSMTPDCSFKLVTETASAAGTFTINAPTDCAPQNGQRVELDITNYSASASTLSWNSTYMASSTLALPTAGSAAAHEDDFVFSWSAALSKWKLLAYNLGF